MVHKSPKSLNSYNIQRRINNEAAHRSRAKRKRIIEEKTSKIDYYETENPKLRQKLGGIL